MLSSILKKTEDILKTTVLFVVDVGMSLLWFIDKVTDFSAKELTHFSKKFLLSIVVGLSFIFLGYFMYSGYLTQIADYIFVSKPPQTQIILSYPYKAKYLPNPEISAKSVIAVDREKGTVLFEKNSNEKLAPASTAKLLTALVVLDLYKPYDELNVPKECTQVEGTKAGLPEKSVFKVRDLVYSMLVGSIADAACVLASGKVSNGAFVNLMNQKLSSLGLKSTHLSNPIGLDGINGENYSSALDLYKLAIYATSVPDIKLAVRSPSYVLRSVDGKYSGTVYSTNRFLWEVPNTVGIKTGTTVGAGEVLIYEYNDGLKDIIIVVMGSADRFSDTKIILNWILKSYKWK